MFRKYYLLTLINSDGLLLSAVTAKSLGDTLVDIAKKDLGLVVVNTVPISAKNYKKLKTIQVKTENAVDKSPKE